MRPIIQCRAEMSCLNQQSFHLRDRLKLLCLGKMSTLTRAHVLDVCKRVSLQQEAQDRDAEGFAQSAGQADHAAPHAAFSSGKAPRATTFKGALRLDWPTLFMLSKKKIVAML